MKLPTPARVCDHVSDALLGVVLVFFFVWLVSASVVLG